MVEVGQKAPVFKAKDTFGKKVMLSDFVGKNLVLYFYPRDNTPGCTIEACKFRDDYSVFKKKRIEILGVSMDSEESHQKFTKKFELPFRLLADLDGIISKKYGVLGEKTFFGRKFRGIKRTTFLIDKKGRIMKIFKNVKVKDHSKEILEIFKKT